MDSNISNKKLNSLLAFILIPVMILEFLSLPVSAYKNEVGMLLAEEPVNRRIYTICAVMEATVNYHPRVVDIEQPRVYWSNVSTYESTGVDWQEWEFIDYGSYWKIKSLKPDTVNNRDNYLSIAADSPNVGANAWVWFNCNGTGQRFHIVNVAGTPYYQFFTACSGYTLALGVNPSNHNIEQMNATSAYTYFRLYESASNHGAIDGKAYIMQHPGSYSSNGANFMYRTSSNIVLANTLGNSESRSYYDWNIKYAGHGYFNIFCSDEDDDYYLCDSYSGISISSTRNNNNVLWKIEYDSSDDSYSIISKSAYERGEDPYLGCTNTNDGIIDINYVQLVSSSDATRKWAICFSEDNNPDNQLEYNKYDLSLVAINDASHSQTHSDIINFAVQSIYIRKGNIFNLTHAVGAPVSKNTIKNGLSNSRIFGIRTHGTAGGSLVLVPNQGTGSNFSTSDLPSDLSYLQIGIFSACYSAIGSYSSACSSNLVYNAVEKGAKCAIGFDGTVMCSDADKFLDIFFNYYSSGSGSPYFVAMDAFEFACTQAFSREYGFNSYYHDGFEPFYDSKYTYITYSVTDNECYKVTTQTHHGN